jgi:3-oxo-5-alpha-steroid 4-dehydrogenase 1
MDMETLFEQHALYAWGLCFVAVMGLCSFPILFFISAPYGRHWRKGWGPTIKARWGWVIMEAPSPLCFGAVYVWSGASFDGVPMLLAGIWMVHYLYRSFVFPFRMRGGDKGKPLLTVVMAFAFNVANGGINAYAITIMAPHLVGEGALSLVHVWVGIAVFVCGWVINQQSDAILLGLRKPGETGYKIPHGGMYRWVSCPNYLGEFIEWCGFAIAACTPAAALFAAFTFANLFPRALSHHRWYQGQFPDYPSSRKAMFPGLI